MSSPKVWDGALGRWVHEDQTDDMKPDETDTEAVTIEGLAAELREKKRLLKGARDALRSYQFGNAAADLAKEVADAIDGKSIDNPRETTADLDRHTICEIGRLFWKDRHQCYSADAVFREVKKRLERNATLEAALFPRPELTGSYPLVLFFNNPADRDELIVAARVANPNLKAEPL